MRRMKAAAARSLLIAGLLAMMLAVGPAFSGTAYAEPGACNSGQIIKTALLTNHGELAPHGNVAVAAAEHEGEPVSAVSVQTFQEWGRENQVLLCDLFRLGN